ncbi:D-serine deaminase, pyridoxal phosphate-dependent [Frankineae bacterium MT45]|nr:D-serine deaminase, pyridoxal phosphate-dependent [Frankineae bacterium MT45]
MLDLDAIGTSNGVDGLRSATAHLQPPYAVIDLGALRHNALDMTRRASGTAIRVASKSIRCRAITDSVLAVDGFHGVLAFTLPEAIWLASRDSDLTDIVVGYPTADTDAIRQLVDDERLRARITLMVDSADHLHFLAAATAGTNAGANASAGSAPLRVCLDLDASLRAAGGRIHLGTRRSPTHSLDQATELARAIVAHPAVTLVGLMSYEGQIAGIGDNQPGSGFKRAQIRAMQRISAAELGRRRAEVVAAISPLADLEFVNGGGTGSLESTSAESVVTEIAAGSGLFAPALFDNYRTFHPLPAAYFVLPVVRRPSPQIATVLGGGWVASGPAGADRLPTPTWPRGLKLSALEGAGEVQTPLSGAAAADLRVGDRVWFRHAKAGELCERVNELHLVDGGEVVATVPTYRGEGKAFA